MGRDQAGQPRGPFDQVEVEAGPEPAPGQALGALVYNGIAIRDRDGKLNLTDMWKAAGADPSRQPGNWIASAEAQRFKDFLAEIQTPGISGSLIETKEGRGGGTWAHWQLGLASRAARSTKWKSKPAPSPRRSSPRRKLPPPASWCRPWRSRTAA